MELFDYKPELERWHGQEIPDSHPRHPAQFGDGHQSVDVPARSVVYTF